MVPIVVYGKNRVESKNFLDRIEKKLKKEGYTIEKISIDSATTEEKILNSVNAPPLLGGKQAVFISYLSERKPSYIKTFLQALKNVLPTTQAKVVFFEPYEKSAVAKQGKKWMWKIVEIKSIEKRGLSQAVTKKLGESGVKISYQQASQLAERIGEDDSRLHSESEKIAALVDEVTSDNWEVIEKIVPASGAAKIWTLIDAILAKDRNAARKELEKMLENGEDPIPTLHLIYQQIRKLAKYLSLAEANGPRAATAERIGVPPFALKKYSAARSKHEPQKVADLLMFIAKQEQMIKTGEIDPETALVGVINQSIL